MLFGTRKGAAALVAGLLAAAVAAGAHAQTKLGYIVLKGSPLDRENTVAALFGASQKQVTLRTLVAGLDAAASDESLAGVLIRLKEPRLTPAQVDEIGAAIKRVREAGKKVHIFGDIYGQNELRLGAHADEIIIQQGGAVSFPGVYAEEMYLAGTLEWLGMEFDRVQIGDYKGAMETLAVEEPTEAWEENINTLLDGLFEEITTDIAEGRGLSDAELLDAMADCFFALPELAIEHDLIDAEVDRLALDEHLEERYGAFEWVTRLGPLGAARERDIAQMGFFESFAYMMEIFSGQAMKTTPTRDTIAVLHIKGPIMDGESSSGGLFGGQTVGSLTIREALKTLEDDPLIRGVVVRIDSPGGSAIASESIWQGLRRVAEDKPVYASVASMAASGGYYIAVGADTIYVDPTSIVGSIGVVGGKLVMEGLYDKIHANVVARSRGPMAEIMSTTRAWSPTEREKLKRTMSNWYEKFTQRIETTRPSMDLSTTAEGRLFVGADAVELDMADRLGGIEAAIDDMASALGLTPGGYDVMDYPAPKSFEEIFEDAFPMAAAPADASLTVAALREALGEAAFAQVRDALVAMLQVRDEPVILATPRVLIIR